MTANILEQVQGIAADVLMIPEEQVGPQSSPESIENWDSVQHLSLVLALEERFGVQFDPEEIDQMRSIGQIAALLENKVGAQ